MARFDLDELFESSHNDVFSDYISDSEVELGEYDEDGCYNVGEMEGLLEKYLNESRNLFSKGFKDLIRQVYLKQKKLDKLSDRMWERKRKLREMRKEIDEEKNNLDKYKADVAMGYLKDIGVIMYKPGQIVYVVKGEQVSDGPCPRCSGKGQLFIETDGIKYTAGCPICNPKNSTYGHGNTYHTEYNIKEGIIEEMTFTLYSKAEDSYRDCKVKLLDKSNFYSDNRSLYVRFKGDSKSTDVIYNKVFLTKEDAEKYVEECKANNLGNQVPKW